MHLCNCNTTTHGCVVIEIYNTKLWQKGNAGMRVWERFWRNGNAGMPLWVRFWERLELLWKWSEVYRQHSFVKNNRLNIYKHSNIVWLFNITNHGLCFSLKPPAPKYWSPRGGECNNVTAYTYGAGRAFYALSAASSWQLYSSALGVNLSAIGTNQGVSLYKILCISVLFSGLIFCSIFCIVFGFDFLFDFLHFCIVFRFDFLFDFLHFCMFSGLIFWINIWLNWLNISIQILLSHTLLPASRATSACQSKLV